MKLIMKYFVHLGRNALKQTKLNFFKQQPTLKASSTNETEDVSVVLAASQTSEVNGCASGSIVLSKDYFDTASQIIWRTGYPAVKRIHPIKHPQSPMATFYQTMTLGGFSKRKVLI